MAEKLKNIDWIKEKLLNIDYELTPEALKSFYLYHDLILNWNRRTNLVSPGDEFRLLERHFLESIALLFSTNFTQSSHVLDLGTGAGFPGIPMKILRNDLNFVLLDSKRMKCLFLKEVIKQLALTHIDVWCERAENLTHLSVDKFDFVVSRAVTRLDKLWEWSSVLLKEAGTLLVMKGGDVNGEVSVLEQKFKIVDLQVLDFPENLISKTFGRKIVALKKKEHSLV